MYDVAHAGANHHREEKDLVVEFLAMNPLLHLHLGHPLQGANQVLAGHTMPASLGEVKATSRRRSPDELYREPVAGEV